VSRQAEIIDALQDEGFQSVNSLAARFEVTASTIRRDLERLEAMDLLQRTHGGAIPIKQLETPHQFKEELHLPEKAAIGQAMADRILEGQTVLLDGGTTTLEVARHLSQRRLTVVTNDLRIGMEIAKNRSAHLVFIGGELLPNIYTMWGPSSVQQLSNLRVDVAVFGADMVSDDGLYHSSSYEVELKRLMRSIARGIFCGGQLEVRPRGPLQDLRGRRLHGRHHRRPAGPDQGIPLPDPDHSGGRTEGSVARAPSESLAQTEVPRDKANVTG
jgi:DeoR/GlpR family transcriptional regulator of sugar metabolism